jgi:membrane-bound serine protease (ClpP class)
MSIQSRRRLRMAARLCGLAVAAVCLPMLARGEPTSRPDTAGGRPVRSHYERTARYLSYDLPKPPYKVAVIDCEDMVTTAFYDAMNRRVDEALGKGATLLVFEITTPGGLTDVSDEIMQMLLEVGKHVHTVAYIPEEASSAGAFIACSCQDIVMGPTATMGSSAVVAMGGEIDPIMRKKLEARMASQWEVLAETNGYPPALCKAMSFYEMSVFSLRNRNDGQIYYFERADLPDDADNWELSSRKLIVDNEKLLNMTGAKAVEYGFASAVVASREELLERYEIEGKPMFLKLTWSESMFSFLANPILQGILMSAMLIGIFMELRTPGVGLPGLVALICFVLLFGSSLFLGLSQWWAPLALGVGVVLLFIELFVTPGFGVLGISGILLMLVGLYGLFVPPAGEGGGPNFVPATDFGWQVLQQGMIVLPVSLAATLAFLVLVGRFLPKVPLLGKVVLGQTDAERRRVTASGVSGKTRPDKKEAKKLPQVGQHGVVRSILRPSGTAEIEGRLIDVVCDGDFIEAGAPVQVARVEDHRVFVQRVNQ